MKNRRNVSRLLAELRQGNETKRLLDDLRKQLVQSAGSKVTQEERQILLSPLMPIERVVEFLETVVRQRTGAPSAPQRMASRRPTAADVATIDYVLGTTSPAPTSARRVGLHRDPKGGGFRLHSILPSEARRLAGLS